MLISLGFAAMAGSIAGIVIARGLDEQAGFVSPLLTLLAGLFAATAIIGGEAILARFFPATGHMRFIIVGTAMIVASVWIVKYTLLDA